MNQEDNKDKYLFIPDYISNSPAISNYAIGVYCALQALNSSTFKRHCITPQQIYYYLFEDDKPTKYKVNFIRCGLDDLIKEEIINQIGEINKCYILDCSSLWIEFESSKYTMITFDEVRKIFHVENTNNFLLLKYFIFIISTISSKIEVWLDPYVSKKHVVGNFTIDYISQISGISERSIVEYNKILEDIGLLYINRQNDFVINDDKEIRQLSNAYGRPSDREYIDNFVLQNQKYRESYKHIKKSISTVNYNRRLAQMYVQLLKGNDKKYSEYEIKTIYDYVVSENKKYERLYEKDGYDDYLEKKRDVSVFEKYNFIRKKE